MCREMISMKIDPLRRYESSDDFFDLNGGVIMKMSANAATAVCDLTGTRGLVITVIAKDIARWVRDPSYVMKDEGPPKEAGAASEPVAALAVERTAEPVAATAE